MVDRQSVDEMTRLLSMLNEAETADAPIKPAQAATEQARPSGHADPKVAAMKNILETFNGFADDVVKDAMQGPVHDVVLERALVTEETSDGVSIGNFAIHVHADGARKFYDVTNVRDGSRIATDLTLYEAAYGIASALHEGQPITSRRVRDLLIAEEAYTNALHDMILFKSRLKKGVVESRRAVIEDRYEAAKGHAVSARSRVKGLARLNP